MMKELVVFFLPDSDLTRMMMTESVRACSDHPHDEYDALEDCVRLSRHQARADGGEIAVSVIICGIVSNIWECIRWHILSVSTFPVSYGISAKVRIFNESVEFDNIPRTVEFRPIYLQMI